MPADQRTPGSLFISEALPNATASRRVPPPGSPTHFARRVAVAWVITLLFLVGAFVCWSGVHVLLQAFAGVLFAVFLSALSDLLSRHSGLSYGKSLLVVVVALCVVTGATVYLLESRLALQLSELTHTLPRSLEQVRDYLAQYEWGQLVLEQTAQGGSLAEQFREMIQVRGLLTGVTNFAVSLVIFLFVGIFGASEPQLYRDGVLALVPLAHRQRATEALDAVTYNLHRWLVGQAVLMIIIGATSALGLWLIGIPMALALGVIAGILELVPYVGAWIAAVPAILIALLVSPVHLFLVAGLYLFLHILEGYVLFPLIQSRAVHLPPALTLVTQALVGEVFGLLGLFVAAPLTLTVIVLVKMLYVEDALGDSTVDVPGEPGNDDHKEGEPAQPTVVPHNLAGVPVRQ
jgi:predicted PurR-regulated permease PerM